METTLTPLPGMAATQARTDRSAHAGRGVPIAAGPQAIADAFSAEGFEALMRAHQQKIFRVVLGVVRDTDAADTLTQETFLRAYRKRASFRGDASLGTWLVRIAMNLAIDHTRNRRAAFWSRLLRPSQSEPDESGAAPMLEAPDPQASPERALAARQQLELAWAAAGELPAQQRAIFMLRFAEEMSLAEIADAMDLQVGTVKAHLFRAVSTVRERMKKRT